MKKLISLVLLLCFMANVAMADCDFKTGITPMGDGTFRYSGECHRKVGDLVQDNTTKAVQITDLTKALELKDLALQKSDQRAQLWMDTSSKLEDRLSKIDELSSKNSILYFGLGVVVTGLAVWGAGQLVRK